MIRSTFTFIVLAVLAGATLQLTQTGHLAENQAVRADCPAPALPLRVELEGGVFTMGAGALYSEEGPPRSVEVTTFWIDRHEVTNQQFHDFVNDTGYVTIAERVPDPAMNPGISPDQLVAGSAVFTPPSMQGAFSGWWSFVAGAHWAQPRGPGSNVNGLEDYPVVHIAYEDAKAYAEWAGGALPTEMQWEFAARGGLDGATYSWGEEDPSGGFMAANTWQGIFPIVNSADDGHSGAAPVGCFEPNGYGLLDMTGNVWEWVDAEDQTDRIGRIKGGSFLCAENYCQRYRPAARQAQEKGFSASHIGFRVAYSAPE